MSKTLENIKALICKAEVRITDHGYDELSQTLQNPPVGAAAWPRSRRRTAFMPFRVLLRDGARASLSVNSRIKTPGYISCCKSPANTGLQPRVYATIGLSSDNLLAREVVEGASEAVLVEDYPDYPKGSCVLVL